MTRRSALLTLAALPALALPEVVALSAPPKSPPKPAPKTPTGRVRPVGFPQDAGPHDKESSIEWWYYNCFLTTEKGRKFSVVASYFRTGLTAQNKGHYLIYSIADLDGSKREAYSILDNREIGLLKAVLSLSAFARPDDPRPLQLLAYLDKNEVPPPHQKLDDEALVDILPRFSIQFDKNSLFQVSDDARTWKAALCDDTTSLDITLTQPTRAALLPGGKGMTGVARPDEMYYLTLSRMDVTGAITIDGVVESVTGTGWLDRQWGSPAFVANYGWDWFGVQLDDGTDLLMYRLRDVKTGRAVKVQATLLDAEGKQTVETPTVFRPTAHYTDKATGIAFPTVFSITLPQSGYELTVSPAFADQTIPVIGIGDAIWEGVVNVAAKRQGKETTGRGYMELVGYKAAKVKGS